ncbi:MAG: ATP-binding protein [Tolumonas sp.]|nr:ATP-binding protein [Tolumonas sp.]
MPKAVQQEFARLRQNPELDLNRYHQIIDTYFGISFSDPSIASTDWFALIILVLVAIPFIVLLGLWVARPLSRQFTQIAVAARAVSQRQFYAHAGLEPEAPIELTRLAHDFNAMTRQLENYERELRASNVAMAHELRSPLTAAIGRLQGMMDGVFDADEKQLQLVMKQLAHLNRLIDDLHLLSLANAGQLTLDKTRINISDLIRDRISWMKPLTEEEGFVIHFTQQDSYFCTADPYRLGQVFSILMENALRYAVEGHLLNIKITQHQDQLQIEFQDQGPGVADEFLPHIFERFSRAETSRARHFGGSGLGLSIAKAICEAHGGTIEAFKLPNAGMRFLILLPIN